MIPIYSKYLQSIHPLNLAASTSVQSSVEPASFRPFYFTTGPYHHPNSIVHFHLGISVLKYLSYTAIHKFLEFQINFCSDWAWISKQGSLLLLWTPGSHYIPLVNLLHFFAMHFLYSVKNPSKPPFFIHKIDQNIDDVISWGDTSH